MKISDDLLVELAIGAITIAGIYWIGMKAKDAATSAYNTVSDAATTAYNSASVVANDMQTVNTVTTPGVNVITGASSFYDYVAQKAQGMVTNQTQCQKDIAAGDKWAASFSCPASDFLGMIFG